MTLTDEIFAHARVLAPDMSQDHQALLEALCRAAEAALCSRLRDNLTPEDCRRDFVTAASMMALAEVSAIGELDPQGGLEQITAGDLTLRRSKNSMASSCLRSQAEMLMVPYVKDPFVFVGV